ncbi:MAG: phage major capsid protein [Clostridia bacterium]|nr:phage major capsid protein [Clostridia bacterium]
MANFETIKLDKGLYNTRKGFLSELERIDPSENYKGTSLEGLDAFERQLKRFDIKLKGAGSSTVDKFFATTDSAVLFPEYVSRAVRQGIDEGKHLDSIIATRTNINGLDYRTITSIPTADEKELKEVAEGAQIPETVVHTQENLVTLKKRGRMLVASYEAIRFQRLDLFTVTLRQIGAYIARSQFKDAVDVLINGDGNNNPAAEIAPATAGTLTYEDLISLWNSFSPYEMNTIIASPDLTAKLLTMPEFRDAAAGLNFHGNGEMITPLGATLIKSTDIDSTLVALDKNYALEMVTAGGVMTDFDKLIDRQLERAAITQISGFAKIFADSSKVMNV